MSFGINRVKSPSIIVGIICNCHLKIKEIGRFRKLTELLYFNGSFLIFLAVERCQPNMAIENLHFSMPEDVLGLFCIQNTIVKVSYFIYFGERDQTKGVFHVLLL